MNRRTRWKSRASACIALMALTPCVQAQLSDEVIAYWPLDEVEGQITPDVIGGYDMNLVNLSANDLVDGRFGNAFSFSNAAQTLLERLHSEGDQLPANQHEAFTISLWVNGKGTGQTDLRAFSEGSTGSGNPLFNIGTHNGATDDTMDIYVRNGDGTIPIDHGHSVEIGFDNQWRHM